eukprot:GHVQ01024945.1.p2 GENE.GHVQ01024945.1~~GHVQ01024945.1.p2  ORF type:complete len:384 (-),score=42.74 GHVQ01024945.1:2523-3674(-)
MSNYLSSTPRNSPRHDANLSFRSDQKHTCCNNLGLFSAGTARPPSNLIDFENPVYYAEKSPRGTVSHDDRAQAVGSGYADANIAGFCSPLPSATSRLHTRPDLVVTGVSIVRKGSASPVFGALSSNPYRRIDPQTLQINPLHSIQYPPALCDIPLSSDCPPSEHPSNLQFYTWRNALKNSATKGQRKQRECLSPIIQLYYGTSLFFDESDSLTEEELQLFEVQPRFKPKFKDKSNINRPAVPPIPIPRVSASLSEGRTISGSANIFQGRRRHSAPVCIIAVPHKIDSSSSSIASRLLEPSDVCSNKHCRALSVDESVVCHQPVVKSETHASSKLSTPDDLEATAFVNISDQAVDTPEESSEASDIEGLQVLLFSCTSSTGEDA